MSDQTDDGRVPGSASPALTRRDVVRTIPIAALGAAALGAKARAEDHPPATVQSIQIPPDLVESLNAPTREGSFEGNGKTGAEIFASLCKAEDLGALFCAPGNYPVINAIAQAGIPSYGGRTECSMVMAADGFARVTGEVVACSGTEGPGMTHMIMGLYTAWAASTPLLMLASNMQMAQDDNMSNIQALGDTQQAITSGIKKYGKRIILPERIYEYGGYAFRALKSGVPGPVHLDFPAEVAKARFTDPSKLTMSYDKSKYRSESRPSPNAGDLARAVELIAKSERPLIIAGQGVFYRKAWDVLRAVIKKHECGVCASGPSRGHFPDDDPLSLSHAPKAQGSADLVIFVGQYLMPTPMDWRLHPDVKTIRVHPVQEELGRNWPLDLGIVSDELEFLQALANHLPAKKRPQWVTEIAAGRQAYQKEMDDWYALGLKYSASTHRLHPTVIGRELYNFFYNGKIDPKQTTSVYGGLTCVRFVPQYLRANRPGQGVCSYYQTGTIGTEVCHGIGAAAAVKEGTGIQAPYKGAPTLVVASDASLGYSIMDFDTAAKYRLPLIVVVYNNNAWGTYPSADSTPRALQMYLFQENLRYDKMAEALGCNGEYVQTAEELRAALARAYDIASKQSIPTLINAQAIKEFTSGKLYPPGASIPIGPGVMGVSH